MLLPRIAGQINPLRRLTRHISTWNESSVVTDRKSRFQGRHVPLNLPEEIPQILAEFLKEHKNASKASHPHIIAWRTADTTSYTIQPARKPSGSKKNSSSNDHDIQPIQYTNVQQGYQDNGEKGAGIKILEQVLVQNNLYNVLVIVTRWYGGTPIGNSRYRHIVNVSLESLRGAGLIRGS